MFVFKRGKEGNGAMNRGTKKYRASIVRRAEMGLVVFVWFSLGGYQSIKNKKLEKLSSIFKQTERVIKCPIGVNLLYYKMGKNMLS